MKLLAIRRDAIFSPNSIGKDRIILQQVMDGLGTSVRMIDETRFSAAEDADVYVSMARHKRTLELLKAKEDNGALVINSAYGVERCERSLLDVALREQGIPVPNSEGSDGYWLKRGDMSAQHKGDVVYCKDRAELAEQQASFVLRGITNWIVQAHVPGDLVKFYAVQGGFFRYFYPNEAVDEGQIHCPEGYYTVFFPSDVHRPLLAVNDKPIKIRKVVVKVHVSLLGE